MSSIMDRYTSSLNSSSISLVSNHVALSFWSNSPTSLYDRSSSSCAPCEGMLSALAPRQSAANTAMAHQYSNLLSMTYESVSEKTERRMPDMLMTRARTAAHKTAALKLIQLTQNPVHGPKSSPANPQGCLGRGMYEISRRMLQRKELPGRVVTREQTTVGWVFSRRSTTPVGAYPVSFAR